MPSKRFRNYLFYVGDLVKPLWRPKEPIGYGIVLDVKIIKNIDNVIVLWQDGAIIHEAMSDIEVVSQVDVE